MSHIVFFFVREVIIRQCVFKNKIKFKYEIESFSDLPTLKFWPGRQETGLYFVFALVVECFDNDFFSVNVYNRI